MDSEVHHEEAAPLVAVEGFSSDARQSQSRARDAHILSFAFLFIFSAYAAAQNLQSIVNTEQGLGTTSMGILYLSFTFFSIFASLVVRWLGSKRALVLGTTGYFLFIASNLKPSCCLASILTDAGAFASHLVAQIYGLNILEKGIQIESRPQRNRPLGAVDDLNNGTATYFDYLFHVVFQASMAASCPECFDAPTGICGLSSSPWLLSNRHQSSVTVLGFNPDFCYLDPFRPVYCDSLRMIFLLFGGCFGLDFSTFVISGRALTKRLVQDLLVTMVVLFGILLGFR